MSRTDLIALFLTVGGALAGYKIRQQFASLSANEKARIDLYDKIRANARPEKDDLGNDGVDSSRAVIKLKDFTSFEKRHVFPMRND